MLPPAAMLYIIAFQTGVHAFLQNDTMCPRKLKYAFFEDHGSADENIPRGLLQFHPGLLHEGSVLHSVNHLKEFKLIGTGAQAKIFHGWMRFTDEEVIVKELIDRDFEENLHEANIMGYLQDIPTIPRLYGFLPTGPDIADMSLVSEFLKNSTSLDELLTLGSLLPECVWIDIAKQITTTLQEIHKRLVLYNDLHTNNILVSWRGSTPTVHIADFGHCTFRKGMSYSSRRVTKEDCKLYGFLAPEVWFDLTTVSSDVYSVGDLLQYISRFVGNSEFNRVSRQCKAIDPSRRPPLRNVNDFLVNLYKDVCSRICSDSSQDTLDAEASHSYHEETADMDDTADRETTADRDYTAERDSTAYRNSTTGGKNTAERETRNDRESTADDDATTNDVEDTDKYAIVDETTITLPLIAQEYLNYIRSDGETIWLRHSGETKIALASHTLSNMTVVIKMFKDSSFDDIRHEANVNYIMSDTSYVPEFLGLTQSGTSLNNLSIVQEYFAEGQTLQDIMCLVHKFDPQVKLVLAIQLAEAMSSFHRRDLIISNFKTDNILFDFVDSYPVIKLIDLGKCSLQNGYAVSKTDDLDSLDYIAPELKDGGVTSFAADVYGLGVILRGIFEGCGAINVSGLIKQCMEKDPRLRPPAEEAAEHLMNILADMNDRPR